MGFYDEDDEDYWDDDYYLRTQEEEEREKWEDDEEDEWEDDGEDDEEDEWEDDEEEKWEDDENDEGKFNPDITNVCKTKVNIEKPIVNHVDKGLPVKLTKSAPKPMVTSKSVTKSSINTSFSSALGDAFLVVVIIILGWVVWNVLTLIANIPWYALKVIIQLAVIAWGYYQLFIK